MVIEAHDVDGTQVLIDMEDRDVTFIQNEETVTLSFDMFHRAQVLLTSALSKAVNMRE